MKPIKKFFTRLWANFLALQFQFKWVAVFLPLKLFFDSIPWWFVVLPSLLIVLFICVLAAILILAAICGADFKVTNRAS